MSDYDNAYAIIDRYCQLPRIAGGRGDIPRSG